MSCFTQTRSYELFSVKGFHVPWSKASSCRLHLRASLVTPRNEADVHRLTDAEHVDSPPASAALSPTVPVASTPSCFTPRRSYELSTAFAADMLRRAAVLAMEQADGPVKEADGQDATDARQAPEGAVTRTTEDAGATVGKEMEMEPHATVIVNHEEENGAPAATTPGCEEQYETCDEDVDLAGLGTGTWEAPPSVMQVNATNLEEGLDVPHPFFTGSWRISQGNSGRTSVTLAINTAYAGQGVFEAKLSGFPPCLRTDCTSVDAMKGIHSTGLRADSERLGAAHGFPVFFWHNITAKTSCPVQTC